MLPAVPLPLLCAYGTPQVSVPHSILSRVNMLNTQRPDRKHTLRSSQYHNRKITIIMHIPSLIVDTSETNEKEDKIQNFQ